MIEVVGINLVIGMCFLMLISGVFGWLSCSASHESKHNRELSIERSRRNYVYLERAHLVAALAKIFPSRRSLTIEEDLDPEWQNVVYIELPTGQVSWHIHEDHLHTIRYVQFVEPDKRNYDGHTTEEKYKRLDNLDPSFPLERKKQ